MREAKTPDGFRLYVDEPKLRIVESSLAFSGPHVWIFGGREPDGHVELSVEQARRVRDALAAFVRDAGSDVLTEPRSDG